MDGKHHENHQKVEFIWVYGLGIWDLPHWNYNELYELFIFGLDSWMLLTYTPIWIHVAEWFLLWKHVGRFLRNTLELKCKCTEPSHSMPRAPCESVGNFCGLIWWIAFQGGIAFQGCKLCEHSLASLTRATSSPRLRNRTKHRISKSPFGVEYQASVGCSVPLITWVLHSVYCISKVCWLNPHYDAGHRKWHHFTSGVRWLVRQCENQLLWDILTSKNARRDNGA